MNKDTGAWFKFGLSDFIAISMSIVCLIYTLLYDAGNLFFYLLVITLILSLFMEKGVQIYVIATSFIYFMLSQIFLVNMAESNIFEYLFLTKFSDNFTILLINLLFIILVSGLSIISAILTTYNIRNKKNFNIEYASVFSTILFIMVAFIISFMIAYDIKPQAIDINQIRQALGVQDAYTEGYISDPTPGKVLAFYITIYQFFTFFTIIYFLLFTIILFSTFSLKIYGEKVYSRRIRVSEKESLQKSKIKKSKLKSKKRRRL